MCHTTALSGANNFESSGFHRLTGGVKRLSKEPLERGASEDCQLSTGIESVESVLEDRMSTSWSRSIISQSRATLTAVSMLSPAENGRRHREKLTWSSRFPAKFAENFFQIIHNLFVQSLGNLVVTAYLHKILSTFSK